MKGLTDEFWEIGVFCGDGGSVFGPLGCAPVTMVGRWLPDDLHAFARGCADVRLRGAKMLAIRREGGASPAALLLTTACR